MNLLSGGRIVYGGEILEGYALLFSDKILSCIPEELALGIEAQRIELHGDFVSPGFIDIHINGACGADTMDATHESIEVFSKCLAQHGTTAFLPTSVTSSQTSRDKALENVRWAMTQKMPGATVLGLHLEGPWIDIAHKGAHPQEYIKSQPDIDWVRTWSDVIRIVTFSPKCDPNHLFLKQLRALGIVPALGHTDADFEEGRAAIEAGALSLTHLFNAMNGLHHRMPGMVGAAFCTQVFCELIADGAHVRSELFEPLFKIIGTDRLILVTDSMRAAGLPDGEYDFVDRTVWVRDGVPRLPDGTLAGSALTMDRGVFNIWKATQRPLPEIIKMASLNPAKLLGLNSKGTLEAGFDADIICFDDNLKVKMTFVGGEIVYKC